MNKFLTMMVVGLGVSVAATAQMAAAQSPELGVVFHSTHGFGSAELEKLELAKKVMVAVINSAEFKFAVLNFTYAGKKQFVQNNDLTNEQVYNFMMSGAEQFPKVTTADHEMDLDVELFTPTYRMRNVLGYTDQSTGTISVNRNFYASSEVYEIAMNLTHEWTHKLGFDHDFRSTARRPYSVPYAIGYLVRDLGKKYLNAASPGLAANQK